MLLKKIFDKKINILTLVLSEKNFRNETKNHNHDSVWREDMYFKLREIGITGNIFNVIKKYVF